MVGCRISLRSSQHVTRYYPVPPQELPRPALKIFLQENIIMTE